ncbi:DENN domain containing 3 [Willisornis vidua]|uniref:DENN domain containing 3 n=1 Tax=Willisornis vidua TaxID=1566151 RepID=A0ABQ9DCD0_9PASS|nr:DENN domain containing 3 [Willisornis vidua]
MKAGQVVWQVPQHSLFKVLLHIPRQCPTWSIKCCIFQDLSKSCVITTRAEQQPMVVHLSADSNPAEQGGFHQSCLCGSQCGLLEKHKKGTQRKPKNLPPLDPEVLSVFVPPFISRDDTQVIPTGNNFNKSKRRSFRKKKERPKIADVRSVNGEQKAPDTEDVTVPKDIDLIAVPQLCFPGGLYVTSESKEDHVHFLVFTDVCGNRTYGVVAQHYQPIQDGCIPSNGQAHRESAQTGKVPVCFVPFAVCVISRYPYFNALKDCLSWEVKDHLNYEHRVFNSEEFLKTRAIRDQPFYKKVLETYMFHSFLKARLNRKMDAFARLELSTQSEEDRQDLMFPTPRRLTMEKMASKRFTPEQRVSRRMVMSLPNLQDIKLPEGPPRNSSLRRTAAGVAVRMPPKSITTFKIPEIHFPLMFQCVHSYYTDFFNHLSKAIDTCPPENSALLARYFYLRGLICLMQGKLLNALSDFQNLEKTDLRIFPTDLVRKIVETMPPSECLEAERKPELKRLISRVMEKQREVLKTDDHVKNFELPKTHMQLDDFVKRIQESGIVRDTDTIHRLFDALTVGQQKQIDPETFRDFYNYWKETEAEAQEVNLPPAVIEHLDKNECVYKLSCSVKTNCGVGKIALTQKRLFLLTEGGCPGYVHIAAFRDIEDVKSTTVAFLLLRIPTLRIKTLSKKEVFEANLKTECDLWYLIVKEMWAGKKMADDHKDPQYIQQALTNVLLMDAVVGALQSSKSIYAASKLSYFDRMKNEVPMMVPKTTAETLKHKISPSAGETFPQAIDVLLYTPGHLDPSERLGNAHPKLWCALSEGRVVVFDASTWSIQQHCFKMGRSKLTCMVMVEQSQVWIGSQDSIIYIINTHSMSCNKQLNDHRSDVTDIIVEHKNGIPSEAYSSSLDGTVIAWNTSTLKVNRVFQLPCQSLTSIKLHNDQLWCCTSSCILAVSAHKFQLQMKIEQHLQGLCGCFLTFQLFPERDEVWASYSGSSDLYIWNTKDLSSAPQKIHLQDCSEITCMIRVKNQLWVGSTGRLQGKIQGKIYVVGAERRTLEKELVGHAGAVRALCSAEDSPYLAGNPRTVPSHLALLLIKEWECEQGGTGFSVDTRIDPPNDGIDSQNDRMDSQNDGIDSQNGNLTPKMRELTPKLRI